MADHPITPPPELVQQWDSEAVAAEVPGQLYLATQAARWGADQELEACCEWFIGDWTDWTSIETVDRLRAARRPKPLSLKARLTEAIQNEDLDTALRLVEGLDDSL